MRRGDDEDLSDSSQHEHRDRIVDHRLVVDGHELLAHRHGQGVEAGAGTSCENDTFALGHEGKVFSGLDCRLLGGVKSRVTRGERRELQKENQMLPKTGGISLTTARRL